MKKKRPVIIHMIVSTLLAVGLFLLYDAQTPQCVGAQSCIPVSPVYVVQSNSGWDNGGCEDLNDTSPEEEVVNLSFSGVLQPWMGLREFDMEYTDADHEIDWIEVSTNTGSPPYYSNSVRYTIRICFNDQNNDDDFNWRVRYLIARWL